MAEAIGTASNGHPNLNLTVEEKRVYGQLFKEADPDGFGAVSGDVAVKFFERTKLAPDVLGQIWQIADTENRGFLTPSGFGVVLRLIGHAQAGRTPSTSIAQQPGPLPKFEGSQSLSGAAQPPPGPPPIATQNTGTPASPGGGGPPIRVPALSPDKAAEYAALFDRSGAENGLLPGLVAKQIFERAGLPNETLGRIWNLSDTQSRGALDVTEFVIAMHLLASSKIGAMRGVPGSLPPGLYDAAARRPPPRLNAGTPQRPSSSAGPMQAGFQQPQFTGGQYANMRPQSPISRQGVQTPLSQQSTGEPWLINSKDKQRYDQIFTTVDTAGQGFISGEQAVQFFGNARLPEEVLAQIWDLSDINSDGMLNKDEFAVAMYLIAQQRGSREGRGIMPQSLPHNLIPPSMRKQQLPPPTTTAPAFDAAPVTKPRSAADDLFGLDVFANDQSTGPPPLAAQQIAQSTGGTDAGPFANPRSPISQQTTGQHASSSVFKPFMPSSSFGQSLLPQQTGAPQQQSRSVAEDNLLDDAEPATTSKINNDAAELGNLSNSIGSLSKEMTDLHTSKGQTEQELAQNSSRKRAFQERLAQLRAAYDSEVQQVKSLKDQLATSQADTKRIQQEMAMLEGSHADLSNQHRQLVIALQADQQENAALKERIRQMNAETEQLKPQLEKLKSDARQQKGLVAINKKQLATNEAERDRVKAEIAAAQKEHDDSVREAEESARQAEAAQRELDEAKAIPMPVVAAASAAVGAAVGGSAAAAVSRSPPPQVASPTPSTSSNPFFRRQNSGAVFSPPSGSAIASPAPENERSDAFDSIFGPAVASSSAPPETSFGRESENQERSLPETPSVVEPPAPAPGNEIKSSALPFRAPLDREDSVSSSVRVAAPASRLSPAQTPRALTPDTSTASPASHRQDDPFAVSAVDEEQESIRQTLPRGETQEKLSGLPGAFPGDESRSVTPAPGVNPAAIAVGAGAATLAAGAGIAAVATNNTETAEDKSVTETSKDTNFDDFFGGPAHKKTQSEQLADFDSAFASLGSSGVANGKPATNNQEFPDIQELDDDEDSDSSDEEPARGFDDDFAAPPKPTDLSSTAAGKQPETTPQTLTAPRPELEAASTSTSLPPLEAQTSPPDYNEVVPEDNPNHFPREYKNLLPEREDPTSPPQTAGGSANPGPNPSGTQPAYGPEIGHPANTSSQTTAPAPTKAAPFDFDSAFSNMGAAPIEDSESGSEYDEFTPGGAQSRDKNTEFDPTFDSPAASTRTTATAPGTASFTAHDAVTSPPTNGTSAFSSFPTQPTTSPPPPTDSTNVSHDWDALFAPLSSNNAAPTSSTNAFPSDFSAPLTKQTTQTEIGPGQAATTTHQSIPSSTDRTPSPPRTTVQPASPVAVTTPTQSQAGKLERPQPGRALSEGTEHDDPILKRLTAMGWSRTESLAALERFDYNIDKAADYLTFRS